MPDHHAYSGGVTLGNADLQVRIEFARDNVVKAARDFSDALRGGRDFIPLSAVLVSYVQHLERLEDFPIVPLENIK